MVTLRGSEWVSESQSAAAERPYHCYFTGAIKTKADTLWTTVTSSKLAESCTKTRKKKYREREELEKRNYVFEKQAQILLSLKFLALFHVQ
jgi:hypothetical protein